MAKLQTAETFLLRGVTSCQLYCAKGSELRALDFSGKNVGQWRMYSEISCVSVVDGSARCTSLLVGCCNGHVFRVFEHNMIPQLILEHTCEILFLSINRDLDKLVIVDINGILANHDMYTKRRLWEVVDREVDGVEWNIAFPDMLCYSSHGSIWIKTANFDPVDLMEEGELLGFRGSKLYLLNKTLQRVEISLADHVTR